LLCFIDMLLLLHLTKHFKFAEEEQQEIIWLNS